MIAENKITSSNKFIPKLACNINQIKMKKKQQVIEEKKKAIENLLS